MGTGHAKGSVLFHLRGFVSRAHGDAAWTSLLERLPPDDRNILSGILIMGGWYPVGVWNRALQQYLPANFADPMAGMAELSSYIAQADLTTLYKLVLKVGTPGFIMGRAGSLWGRYFDSGVLIPKEVGARTWRLQLEAPRHEDEAPSVYTCEGVCSWLVGALHLTGASLTIKQTRCRFQGSPTCEYDAHW